ncbi:ribosome silencing factor [Natronogracilivirga saccharolytica]|uniref:Ribosomal silencing factor RsfS n=1 Tax=Natronogracilivirga saccharolytica TaxID=2812953 RepID=A0A8J7S850_9BACT|nr:ribosome silencing factor [Natronogracilivirga saccharolytica]MBP3192023.1 ribosome silencing factor [Natronogracilivirga saccharolytica]
MSQVSQKKSTSDTKNISTENPLVPLIGEALLEKKAEMIRVLDVRNLTTLTDYFIVCQGGSDTQIKAIAHNVIDRIKEQSGENVWKKEGLENRKWVVLDYVDVVVHIFDEETREFYGLESMWNDAGITSIEER